MTLAKRLELTKGRATGFDYLRIGLAITIVADHAIATCYGPGALHASFQGWSRPLIASLLPLFFALSGFLVAGSLERTPHLTRFLGLRVLRIYPALAVETVLSALILGPLLTSYPIGQYFSDPLFRSYLLNAFGVIHFDLPGLFLNNPLPDRVNGQLWTVPFELQCYVLLAVLAFLGIAKRKYAIFWCAVFLQVLLLALKIHESHGHFVVEVGAVHGYALIMTFLAGVVLYVMRDIIPYNFWLFVLSALFLLVGLSVPLGDYFIAYPAAYATVFIGLQNPKAIWLHKIGDLSYGIFLYGFPVQQVVASWGAWTHHWYINLLFAFPMTFAIAWLSWNVVEKRVLSLKRHLDILRPVDSLLESLQNSSRTAHQRALSLAGLRRSSP